MRYFVKEIEHDSWSGPDVISIKEYDSEEEARAAAKLINDQNTAPSAPSYYITACVVNDIMLSEYNRFINRKI